MLYFIQGFYFAEKGIPFLEDGFESWPCGPTVRNLYDIYSVNGSLWIKNIEGRKFDFKKIKKEDRIFLDKAISALNKYSESSLFTISKSQGFPYQKTYSQQGKGALISNTLIKEYFEENLDL